MRISYWLLSLPVLGCVVTHINNSTMDINHKPSYKWQKEDWRAEGERLLLSRTCYIGYILNIGLYGCAWFCLGFALLKYHARLLVVVTR